MFDSFVLLLKCVQLTYIWFITFFLSCKCLFTSLKLRYCVGLYQHFAWLSLQRYCTIKNGSLLPLDFYHWNLLNFLFTIRFWRKFVCYIFIWVNIYKKKYYYFWQSVDLPPSIIFNDLHFHHWKVGISNFDLWSNFDENFYICAQLWNKGENGHFRKQGSLFCLSPSIKVLLFICCEVLIKFKSQHSNMFTNRQDGFASPSSDEFCLNPLMPSGSFNICCPRDCVSRTANEKLVTIVANGH